MSDLFQLERGLEIMKKNKSNNNKHNTRQITTITTTTSHVLFMFA